MAGIDLGFLTILGRNFPNKYFTNVSVLLKFYAQRRFPFYYMFCTHFQLLYTLIIDLQQTLKFIHKLSTLLALEGF